MSWILKNLVGDISPEDYDDESDTEDDDSTSARVEVAQPIPSNGGPKLPEAKLRMQAGGAGSSGSDGAPADDGHSESSRPLLQAEGQAASEEGGAPGRPMHSSSATSPSPAAHSPAEGKPGKVLKTRGGSSTSSLPRRADNASSSEAPAAAVESGVKAGSKREAKGLQDDLAELTGRVRDGLSFFSSLGSVVRHAVTDAARPLEFEYEEEEDGEGEEPEEGGSGGEDAAEGRESTPAAREERESVREGEIDMLDMGLMTLGRLQSMVSQGVSALAMPSSPSLDSLALTTNVPGVELSPALERAASEPQGEDGGVGLPVTQSMLKGEESDKEEEDEEEGESVGVLVSELLVAAKQDMQELSGTLVHGLSGFSFLANKWISVAAGAASEVGLGIPAHKGAALMAWDRDGDAEEPAIEASTEGGEGERGQAVLAAEDLQLREALAGLEGLASPFPGATKEVVMFVHSVSQHPQTWLHFPLPHQYPGCQSGEEWNAAQGQHMDGMQGLVPGLASLREELCPAAMAVSRFWIIYFILLLARLPPDCIPVLCTPQVMSARDAVMAALKESQGAVDPGSRSPTQQQQQLPSQPDTPQPQTPVPEGTGEGMPAAAAAAKEQQSASGTHDPGAGSSVHPGQEAGGQSDLDAKSQETVLERSSAMAAGAKADSGVDKSSKLTQGVAAAEGDKKGQQQQEPGQAGVLDISAVKSFVSDDWNLEESLDELLADTTGGEGQDGTVDFDEDLSFSDLEDD